MRIVIIGNGIAGTTAARHIRKLSDHQVVVISSESPYFFSRTALMYVYMGHLKFEHTQPYEPEFWVKNRITLLHDHVETVDYQAKSLQLRSGDTLSYDKLVIATGSKPNFFGWKGQELEGVQGLYSKQDLELMEKNTHGIRRAVVVGGGLIGIEMAEMLLSRGIEVHFLIREKHFWGSVLPWQESELIMKHLQCHHGLVMHYEEELDEIIGDEAGRVQAIRTKKGTTIDAGFVGITVGVQPNIEFLKSTGIETNRGILTDQLLRTSIPDVYAIGDCAEQRQALPGRRALEQVWYTGRMMGECVAHTLCGEDKPYLPGHWFNSAKFFDIEYQTYGLVPAKLAAHQAEFVWQHPTEELLVHFVFDREIGRFEGLNSFGIRMRHEVCDSWLTQQLTMDDVLPNLAAAVFDPEFYKRYEADILTSYNRQFNKNLTLNKPLWWQKALKLTSYGN